jgi:microsomal dipeptidase-like Zn-dependent dipeptidase
MLEPRTIERIASRGGVIGLIMAQHQLNAGHRVRDAEDFEETKKTIRTHINEIRKHTPSNEYVGIGSDLDGFIKPTVGGIECARDLGKLSNFLREAYPDDAEAIRYRNAERVLRKALVRRKD